MGDFVQVVEWTDALVARMRALWDEGLSTQAIGDRLGISKNAVVGKAHRLNFPSRSSPIKASTLWLFTGDREAFARDWAAGIGPAELARTHGLRDAWAPAALAAQLGLEPRASVARAKTVTLAPLKSLEAVDVPAALPAERRGRAVVPAMPPAAVRVAPPRARRMFGKSGACQFPIGEPGTAEFRFCDELSEPGGPYCVAHHRRCYVPIRDIEARRAELA